VHINMKYYDHDLNYENRLSYGKLCEYLQILVPSKKIWIISVYKLKLILSRLLRAKINFVW
jgi:hypothetical protein